MSWIDELAEALGAEPLSEDEVERLLNVARDGAHGIERKITPPASFLLGMGVQARMQSGDTRATALAAVIADLRAGMPPA
jgi:Domain of unknown function (DUF6457)